MIKRREARDGTVSFQVYSRVTGSKKYVGTFASEKLADEALQDHEVKQRAIKRGDLPAEVDDKRTLDKAVEAWLTSLEKRKSGSHRIHRGRMRLYFRPTLGTVPIDRIHAHHVMAVRDALVAKVSPATINSAVMTLSAAYKYFIKQKWVAVNPCRGVELVEVVQRDYQWVRTSEEISKLIEACQDEIREFVALAFGTGMRLDELLCLQWGDVDLERRLITVQRGRRGPVKGKQVRHVPILDAVLPMLREMALRRGESVRLFPGQNGGVRHPAHVRRMFKRAVKKAGLDPSLRVHDCRHSYASHFVMNGGDIWKLSKILCHKTVVVTERFYAHLKPEAFVGDYGRVRFVAPSGPIATVVPLRSAQGE